MGAVLPVQPRRRRANQTRDGFTYSSGKLADITEIFITRLGLTQFVMYVFDYGAPVGFRIALRHPERIAGPVVQNGNASDEGLSGMFKALIARRPGEPGAAGALRACLTAESIRPMHAAGAAHPDRIDPDIWTIDQHFLGQPGHQAAVTSFPRSPR